MKIAVLGGSFNPIHIAHLMLADCVSKELGYDKIIFVPTFLPPHKQMAVNVSGKDRLKMVELAIENDERFLVDSCELDRGGVSYTYDTICFLEKKYQDVLEGKIGLIIGNDLVADFNKWHRAEELAQKIDLIIATRNEDKTLLNESKNSSIGEFGNGKDNLKCENFPYFHKIVNNPDVLISSSQIRQAIKEKKSFRYLVSEKVFEYIVKRHLYES